MLYSGHILDFFSPFLLVSTYTNTPFHFGTSVQALAAALCMNIYVVGLNQLFDIEIDKVFLC